MKKIYVVVLLTILFVSCQKNNDFLIVKGNIKNFDQKEIIFKHKNDIVKKIVIDSNSFIDTLYLKANDSLESYKESFYVLQIGDRQTLTYLKNGFDINIDVDLNNFEDISYNGKGADNSNYLKEKMQIAKEYINPYKLLNAGKEEFESSLKLIDEKLKELFEKFQNIDEGLAVGEKASDEEFIKIIADEYNKNSVSNSNTEKGAVSPTFKNYESIDGKKVSLEDFKGKYVYIDIWATWCGPCKMEIPFLKNLEKKYHGKNIEFVSISIDQNKESWKKMVKEKELSGVQLHFGQDNSFIDAYKVSGIPRFILIDKEGKIVDKAAPRPSNQEINNLFDALDI